MAVLGATRNKIGHTKTAVRAKGAILLCHGFIYHKKIKTNLSFYALPEI
jgi:hypothetical protein